jgi:hypothetical protein
MYDWRGELSSGRVITAIVPHVIDDASFIAIVAALV